MSSTSGWKLRSIVNSLGAACLFLLWAASASAAPSSNEATPPDADSANSPPSANSLAGSQGEISELKRQLAEQQKQIEELRVILLELTKQSGKGGNTVAVKTQPAESAGRSSGEVASMTPLLPPVSAAPPALSLTPAQKKEEVQNTPLQFQLGSAYFTPVGFMDLTTVFRDTDPGSNIGTNFGSFPYRTTANVAGNLSEFRMSPQNSRLGMRIDALVPGARVIGYWESDFLGGTGNPPVGNISVSSNSYPFRLRLYWADVRTGKFEFLGGQTWSLLTPGRKGISPLPGDLFYTNDIDVNYQVGLVWGRIPEFRTVYHASNKVALAFALGNAEQYIGGSGGAGTIVLPTNLAIAYAPQLNNGTTTLSVPNTHPDLIAKIAFDPVKGLHFEIGAVERTFKAYNPRTAQHFTTAGAGFQANLNLELFKNFRFITNNYWSDGGGRYIFGQAPDLVVRNDGSLSLVKSYSTVTGFEYTHKSWQAYTYYGGVYIGRNVIAAPDNGGLVGYGFTGSFNSQNRSVQEGSAGFIKTFWKDGRYGALSLMGQYAYFVRNPWFVASGTPKNTHMNEVWLNFRYALPGSAPSLK